MTQLAGWYPLRLPPPPPEEGDVPSFRFSLDARVYGVGGRAICIIPLVSIRKHVF